MRPPPGRMQDCPACIKAVPSRSPFLDTVDLFSVTFGERRARGITPLKIALLLSVMTLRPIQAVHGTAVLAFSLRSRGPEFVRPLTV